MKEGISVTCTLTGALAGLYACLTWADGVMKPLLGIDYFSFVVAGVMASCLMAAAAAINNEGGEGVGTLWGFASLPGLQGPLLAAFLSMMQLGVKALGIVALFVVPYFIVPVLMGYGFDGVVQRGRIDDSDFGDPW